MARFRFISALSCVITLLLALSGCIGLAVVAGVGAAAGGGYAAGQERGVNGAVDDIKIKADVERGLMKAELQLQGGIATTVYDGRVLLTGHLASPELKATAERVAGQTPGVRAVYDEIELAQAPGMWSNASDDWITAQVRSKMVIDGSIRSVNYTIETANGSVYLIGSARSQDELDHATQDARYVPGVQRVVSYVEVRSGEPVAAMPPPAYSGPSGSVSGPSGASSGPSRSGAAPQSPIEVQKL